MFSQSSWFMQGTAILDQLARIVGWGVAIVFVWKLRGMFDQAMSALVNMQENLSSLISLTAETKKVVDAVTLNHLQRLQDTIAISQEQHEKQLTILRENQKGIAVLVDR